MKGYDGGNIIMTRKRDVSLVVDICGWQDKDEA